MFFPTLFQHVLQYIFYLFFLKACLSNKLIQLAKDQVEFSSESIDSWILHVPFHQVLQSIPSPRWRRDVKLPVGQLESPTSWPWIWHSGGGFRWWVVTEPVSDMTHLPVHIYHFLQKNRLPLYQQTLSSCSDVPSAAMNTGKGQSGILFPVFKLTDDSEGWHSTAMHTGTYLT